MRLADPSKIPWRKGVKPMTVFEAITLMIAFAALIVMLLSYLNGK